MGAGTIIYLNGTSSSGKTSIARALQERLAEPYLHCPVELFEQMIPHRQIERGVIPELMALQRGFTACVAALAASGNNLIVDDVLCEPLSYPGPEAPITAEALLRQRVQALHGFRLLYVAVVCPLAELERRERQRGDRPPGMARFQFHRVHQGSQYDLEVDTGGQTPDACAAQILAALSQAPRAFRAMAERFAP